VKVTKTVTLAELIRKDGREPGGGKRRDMIDLDEVVRLLRKLPEPMWWKTYE
jgi:hypothetical protein